MPHVLTRTVRRTALALVLVGAALLATVSPANAHTLDEAVRSSAGCGWASGSYTLLESKPLLTSTNAQYGTVNLLWSGTYGENCVLTRKTTFHGVASNTWAILEVQNGPSDSDSGLYAHYAAVSLPAAGSCVKYSGMTQNPNTDMAAANGRYSWGFCG